MATSLRADSARNRNRTFIGREAERDRLARWLKMQSAPTKVVDITGLGGIGKSTLLNIFLHDAHDSGAETAWIDGRACFGTPDGMFRYLPPALLEWMRAPDEDTKWVLGIDNFEALRDLSGWLRRDLFAAGPASNLLILLCERKSSLLEWRLDLDWTGRVEEWALEPFSSDEAMAFLDRRGVPFNAAVSAAAHVPLALAIYVDLYQRGALEGEGARRAREAFSATLLKEVLDTDWREAINILCLVSRAHLDFLNAVLERPLSLSHYRQLASLSFVTDTPAGLGLHDLAAGELLRDFRRLQPEAFQRLRCKVIGALAKSWQQAPDGREDGRLAHDLVRLVGRDLEPWRDYADLYEDPHGLEIVPYQPEDRAEALECLNDWARPAIPMTVAQQAALFDVVATQMPDAIHMVRDPSGQSVATICLLPVTRETLDILSTFVPDIVSHLASHPNLDVNLSRPDDTRLVTMVGLRTQHPVFPAPLLAGAVLRYTLESSSGRRTLGMVLDERFKMLLEKLGWVAYPFPLISKSELLLYSLDLRFEHIPRWAARMTGVSLSDPLTALKALAVADLRQLLTTYHDTDRLQRWVEAQRLAIPPEQLRGILRQAVQAFAEQPNRADAAVLIRRSYLEPHLPTRVALADQFNVSRATFHRRLSRAVTEFAHFLGERV